MHEPGNLRELGQPDVCFLLKFPIKSGLKTTYPEAIYPLPHFTITFRALSRMMQVDGVIGTCACVCVCFHTRCVCVVGVGVMEEVGAWASAVRMS